MVDFPERPPLPEEFVAPLFEVVYLDGFFELKQSHRLRFFFGIVSIPNTPGHTGTFATVSLPDGSAQIGDLAWLVSEAWIGGGTANAFLLRARSPIQLDDTVRVTYFNTDSAARGPVDLEVTLGIVNF